MLLKDMQCMFYLQLGYDKLFSSQFLMESNMLVFLLQQSLFWLRLGSQCILDSMDNILNIMDSRNICKDNPNILNSRDSRSTCCMGSNILMGINKDRIMEDKMILRALMKHDEQVVLRTQQIQQGLIRHHHQYRFFLLLLGAQLQQQNVQAFKEFSQICTCDRTTFKPINSFECSSCRIITSKLKVSFQ